MDNKKLTDVLKEIRENELNFLPDDPALRDGFMMLIKFTILGA